MNKNLPLTEKKHSWKRIFTSGTAGLFGFGKVFIALIIIFLASFYLAKNLGWLPPSWTFSFWKVWPFFIIAAGVAMLTSRGLISAAIGVFVLLTIVVTTASLITGEMKFTNDLVKQTPIEILRAEGTASAALNIHDSLGNLKISANDLENQSLIRGSFDSNVMNLIITKKNEKEKQIIDLESQGYWRDFVKENVNDLKLKLNKNLPFSLTIDNGASALDLDFTDLKISDLNLAASDAAVKIKFTATSMPNATITASASQLDFIFPRSVGVKITTGSPSLSLSDFQRIDERDFVSANYQNAAERINLSLEVENSTVAVTWE
jgi:hypothetical protein